MDRYNEYLGVQINCAGCVYVLVVGWEKNREMYEHSLRVRERSCVCACVYMCVYVCMYVYVCVCVCGYAT